MLAATSSVLALAAAFAIAPHPGAASAAFSLGSYDAHAEAAGVRLQILKPAALPTSDELATLAIPFSRAEASSSPLGRAIGSWLWPGETAADAKSLALVGLDPGADETACAERESGAGRPRTLATVPNPAGGELAIADPSDNPCGSASFKQIFAGQVERDPNSPEHGRRTGGLIRSMPDYPFWAVAQYPSAGGSESERKVLCQAPGAIPAEPWHTPRDVCPPGGAPDAGFAAASASATRDAAQSSVADLTLGPMRAGSIAATSVVTFAGSAIVATATVAIEDLTVFGADATVPLLRIQSLRSTATASSDGTLTAGSFTLGAVYVALPGLPAGVACSAANPCAATIGRDGVTVSAADVPAAVRGAVESAMDALAIRIPPQPADAAGQSASAGGGAAGPGVTIGRTSADVAGLQIGLVADDSVQGRSVVTIRIGGAAASAVAAATAGGPPIDDGVVPLPVTGGDAAPRPVAGDDSFVTPPAAHPVPQQPATRAVASSTLPPSQPIPPAIAILAFFAILAGAAGMVAFGVWETAP